MKFNEKLITLRKEKGMTQEDLAFEAGVSRQSVSKWEQGESEPDLANLRRLSRIFNVTLDELVNEEFVCGEAHEESERTLSTADATDFLMRSKRNAPWIAFGVLLCILSPVALILLGAMSEVPRFSITENVAAGVGLIVLLLLIAGAVSIFVVRDAKISEYRYLEKENFSISHEVKALTLRKKEVYKKRYTRNNVLGACLCILSILPLFIGIIIDENNDFLIVCLLASMFPIAGTGVFFFVLGGVIWGSYNKILQIEDYSKENKKKSPVLSALSVAYWLIVTALFFGVSFFTSEWKYTGLIWVIGGLLYPALYLLIDAVRKPKDK